MGGEPSRRHRLLRRVSARLRRNEIALALAGAIAFAAGPAQGALFDDTEARRRIEITNQRLEQTRRQVEERIVGLETLIKNQGLAEIVGQIEQLKVEISRLRGQVEVLQFELQETQKRQRDLYVDLDTRVRRLETLAARPAEPAAAATVPAPSPAPTPAPAVAPTAAASAAPPASGTTPSFGPPPPPGRSGPAGVVDPASAEQRSYDAALALFTSGNYTGAVTAFANFVRTYPKSPLAPSAQYWIGNSQYALRDYKTAINSQRQLLRQYPDSQKVPDALLNIATSFYDLGDLAESRRTLEDVVARFPTSEAAGKARQRLQSR